MIIKKNIYCWTCDYSKTSGEGYLARKFVKDLSRYYNVIIKAPDRTFYKLEKFIPQNIIERFVYPFFGLINCWYFFLLRKKICYINYLPMWNFLIFIFLPPKTIIGPITGGANYNKDNLINYFIRKFIFPLCYNISQFFIKIRFKKIIFSTELLKTYLNKNLIKKSVFNYILSAYQKKKDKKKDIDFLIYYRKHINKNEFSIKNFINLLIKNKINVNVVGDHYNNPNVKNYGRVSLKRIHYLLARTRFSIASTENLYSLFTMHCISNKVIIYINKNSYNKNIKYFSKNFIKFNFNSKSIKLKKRKITYKLTEFLNIKKTINVFFGSL